MSIRNWVIIGIVWVVSLARVAVTVSAQARAWMYRRCRSRSCCWAPTWDSEWKGYMAKCRPRPS
jgi:hypothetical protein